MIPSTVDLAKAPNSTVLAVLRDALLEHANGRRGFEEGLVRHSAHAGWSAEGAERFRVLNAAAAIIEHIIAEGTDATVRQRDLPRFVVAAAGQARAALRAPLPPPSAPILEADDAA